MIKVSNFRPNIMLFMALLVPLVAQPMKRKHEESRDESPDKRRKIEIQPESQKMEMLKLSPKYSDTEIEIPLKLAYEHSKTLRGMLEDLGIETVAPEYSVPIDLSEKQLIAIKLFLEGLEGLQPGDTIKGLLDHSIQSLSYKEFLDAVEYLGISFGINFLCPVCCSDYNGHLFKVTSQGHSLNVKSLCACCKNNVLGFNLKDFSQAYQDDERESLFVKQLNAVAVFLDGLEEGKTVEFLLDAIICGLSLRDFLRAIDFLDSMFWREYFDKHIDADELKCPICEYDYDNSDHSCTVTPCKHSLCYLCANQVFGIGFQHTYNDGNKSSLTKNCPICRNPNTTLESLKKKSYSAFLKINTEYLKQKCDDPDDTASDLAIAKRLKEEWEREDALDAQRKKNDEEYARRLNAEFQAKDTKNHVCEGAPTTNTGCMIL